MLIAGWDGGLGPKMVQQSESAVIVFFSSFWTGNAFVVLSFRFFAESLSPIFSPFKKKHKKAQ